MVQMKFLDSTPVPDNYLAAISRLVRGAVSAVDLLGEDALEAASAALAPAPAQPPDANTEAD